MMKTPPFWYPRRRTPIIAFALWPLTLLWRLGAFIRQIKTPPYLPKTHTIVIGNLTAGGTGKTPVVAALAVAARAANRCPVVLTRGYGGTITGPHLAQDHNNARDIGDEACWIAASTPVVVAHDRGAGARWIDEHMPECDLIIMDDGLQNPAVKPHQSVAVFNGSLGTGNGMIIPAGPLREGWGRLRSCDAVVISGDDHHNLVAQAKTYNPDIAVFMARRRLNPDDLTPLVNKPIFAFAGIGAPDVFFAMLDDAGLNLAGQRAFPDHHPYSDDDYERLTQDAAALGAVLVTTEKDMMRLDTTPSASVMAIRLDTSISPDIMDILASVKV